MSESKTYPVSAESSDRAWIDDEKYQEMYKRSIEEPDEFWADQASQFIDWYTPCLLYTSPSPRDQRGSRMPSSA